MERSIQDRAYSPHTVALSLIAGIVTGVLGSLFGWFAPVHEFSHAMAVWAMGGQVVHLEWAMIEYTGISVGSPQFRFVTAAGAVGEHLVALVVMVWALLRGKPLLSAIGFGYLAHGMDHAWRLAEWRYLRQPFFDLWHLATGLVYILLVTVGFTYFSWVAHVAYLNRSKRKAVRSNALARYPM